MKRYLASACIAVLLLGTGSAGWHYLLMTMHMGIGFLLGSMGIVGEYLGRVHEQVKQRPLYLLKESHMHTEASSDAQDAKGPLRREAA